MIRAFSVVKQGNEYIELEEVIDTSLFELIANKNKPLGYVGLNSNLEISALYIPNLPISRITNLQSELEARLGIDDTAKDSLRLGGELPEFYASQDTTYTKEEVDNAITISSNSVVAQLLDNPDADINSIAELNNLIQGNLSILSTKVSYTETQSLTTAQKNIAQKNIGIFNHNHDTLYYKKSEITSLLSGKVDNSSVLTDVPANALFTDTTYTVKDGELSEKNFTQTLYDKLNAVRTDAQKNVQSDWNATSGDAQILNKPTIPNLEQFLRSDIDDSSSGKITFGNTTTNRTAGIYGVYNSSKIAHIWSMGLSYKIKPDGTGFGNLYGFAYKHGNAVDNIAYAGGHQAIWCHNGSPNTAIGNNLWAKNYALTNGFKKHNSSDAYVLLGGGGHRLLSDFSLKIHSHDTLYYKKTEVNTLLNNRVKKTGDFLSGTIGRTAYNTGHFVGGHNNIGNSNNKTNPIFTLGHSYLPLEETLANMYGLGFAYSSASFLNQTDLRVDPLSGYGTYYASGGKARIFLNATRGSGYFKAHVYTSGVKKHNSSDNYVLLGGGGHKLLSEILSAPSTHNHDTLYYKKSEITSLLNTKVDKANHYRSADGSYGKTTTLRISGTLHVTVKNGLIVGETIPQ